MGENEQLIKLLTELKIDSFRVEGFEEEAQPAVITRGDKDIDPSEL